MSRLRLFVSVAGLILSLVAIGTGRPWARWLAIIVLAAALALRFRDRRSSHSKGPSSYNATDAEHPEGQDHGPGSSNT